VTVRWKTAGVLVAFNITMALAVLVILGTNDPNWVENAPQIAEKASSEVVKLAGLLP